MRFFLNSLQQDLIKKHIGPFLFCFFTVMFLLLMQFLILHVDKLVGKGLPLSIIIELILTNLAYMVVLAGPMAVLVSTLMAFGKFSELNELTALRASGVSPFRMILPVLALSILLAGFMAYFSNEILPEANHKARSLFIDIRLKKPGFDLQENIYYDGIDGYTFLVKEIDTETDSLYDVTLYQTASGNRNRAIIKAEQGILKSENPITLTLYLYDGYATQFYRQNRNAAEVIEKTKFDDFRITFDLSELSFSRSNPQRRSRSDRTMRAQAMMAVVDSLSLEIESAYDKTADHIAFEVIKSKDIREPKPVMLNTDSTTITEPQEERFVSLNTDFEYLAASLFPDVDEQKKGLNNTKAQLRNYKATLDNVESNVTWRKKRIAKFLVEVHKKLSIPFACIVFVLIGAPIGILTRRGNLGYAAIISAGILTFYWISLIQGEKMADRLFITPFQGMWFSNIFLGIIGIYLIIHINTEYKITKLWKR